LKNNLPLKDRYMDQRCFIFGTGASINDIDIGKFSKEYTFACNSFFLHQDFSKLNLSFFAMVDGIHGLWQSHIPWDRPPVFFSKLEQSIAGNEPIFFFNISTKKFIKKNRLLRNKSVYYVVKNFNKKGDYLTSMSLHKKNDFLIGALPFMIASSIYMGFKELYLFGMGFTYEPTQHGHFYDPPEILEEAKTWANRPIVPMHHVINKMAEDRCVKIFNVVPNGFKSPAYEAISLEEVYSQLEKKGRND